MRFNISNNQNRATAINHISDCDIDAGLIFTLEKDKLTRSSRQLRFYWMLLTDIQNTVVNEYSGTSKEEWDLYFKRTFLIPIFERDNEDWLATMEALRNLWKANGRDECELIFKTILSKTHFRDADVKQGGEYLTSIIRWCASRGITHRHPDDNLI